VPIYNGCPAAASSLAALVPTHNGRPAAGFVCKYCDKPGGLADSHWLQQCPKRPEGNGFGRSQPPGAGYICKYCSKPGGLSDSHWHMKCPKNPANARAMAVADDEEEEEEEEYED
jgi:hypothetical protein